ncbi:MAG: VanZ family protein [Bacilli bacterium]|nr:VanZ family protein [Bacilli bacterium]
MKNKLVYILLILWLIIIFLFSSMNANNSNGKSKGIIKGAVNITNNVLNLNLSDKKIDKIVTNLNYPIRKCAHVLEYLILGILLMYAIYNNNVKIIYIIIGFIFLYACGDEFHQSFTGRTSKFLDVIIDTLGGTLGVLLYLKKINN